ncbi:MAG: hypothetical protein IPO69_09090 [Saprospiraceae bacterium]|nr:hypothetical protein [Saprospiraceae bacterium]
MILTTTHLSLRYIDGHLRYIKQGEEELIRMIYPAIRDRRWYTVPMTIYEEEIQQNTNSFLISYKASYNHEDIGYEADITIRGDEQDTITFHFKGRATTEFLRNRIGICVLHPIKECLGAPAVIEQPSGEKVSSHFSGLIDPGIVFGDIRKLSWQSANGLEAIIDFEGDTFETEDQRNWSDNSFKTYSTPVSIPFPVLVRVGDIVEQKVILKILDKEKKTIQTIKVVDLTESRYPFPKLGYARSQVPLSSEDIQSLKQIKFDHYRVEIDFRAGWENTMDHAFKEAEALNTPIELVALFDDYSSEYQALKANLNSNIASITLLQIGVDIPDQVLLDYLIPRLRRDFPSIKIGTGAYGHFVGMNRHRLFDARIDYISYGLTPQAHLSDDLTIIENLEAQAYQIETLRSFTDLPIHISPVTFRSRDYPDKTVDTRQHTALAANWAMLSLKYMCGADRITLFESTGPKGIINKDGPSPVYEMLKKITDFQPVNVIKNSQKDPLMMDSLILENRAGERMVCEVNWGEYLAG